jgi:hypothetical protein
MTLNFIAEYVTGNIQLTVNTILIFDICIIFILPVLLQVKRSLAYCMMSMTPISIVMCVTGTIKTS